MINLRRVVESLEYQALEGNIGDRELYDHFTWIQTKGSEFKIEQDDTTEEGIRFIRIRQDSLLGECWYNLYLGVNEQEESFVRVDYPNGLHTDPYYIDSSTLPIPLSN